MDKHTESDYVINQHSKHLDFDNDFVDNEQVLFSIRIPNLNKSLFHWIHLVRIESYP